MALEQLPTLAPSQASLLSPTSHDGMAFSAGCSLTSSLMPSLALRVRPSRLRRWQLSSPEVSVSLCQIVLLQVLGGCCYGAAQRPCMSICLANLQKRLSSYPSATLEEQKMNHRSDDQHCLLPMHSLTDLTVTLAPVMLPEFQEMC